MEILNNVHHAYYVSLPRHESPASFDVATFADVIACTPRVGNLHLALVVDAAKLARTLDLRLGEFAELIFIDFFSTPRIWTPR